MVNYLVKTLILTIFSFIIIYFYYFGSNLHIENFDGYLSYIVIIGIIYAVYKFFQLEFSEKKAEFSIIKICGFFLLHLLVLSVLFFTFNDGSIVNGIVLFFKIIFYSILPISIILISLSFGKKIISYLSIIKNESDIFKFIISLGIGFFSFVFLLDIIGILGFYNLYIVFFILIGFVFFARKEFLATLNGILFYKFKLDIEEGSYLRLISTEFLFLVSTLVLSVSLISIVRPFPIGWDDLGVYMNYPHLMAEAGSIISLGQMYAWQTFTGIGYMFSSPTQAFFLNNVGGVLSFIVLILIISDLLKNKLKTFINIPLLVGTIFISMPMIVFQQAKDMKLDPGLFFVSIITLYLVFKYYLGLDNKSYLEKMKDFVNDKILQRNFHITNLILVLIIGLLAGFAFSIKFTSLLLISAIIGIIFFVRLGVLGFFGYLAVFFAIFTKGNLWKMMNVVVNPNNISGFETNFSLISGVLGIGLIIYATLKKPEIVKKFFMELGIFIFGIFIALMPWLGKNIVESYPNIKISTIIAGTSERFIMDKTLIHTDEELKVIEENKKSRRMSDQGISSNEDLGRYFGYESGINNYVKLPWNLTMQTNQSGEYTDIGFIFLALLPVVLLFLPYRKKWYAYLIVFLLILELLTFVGNGNKLIKNTKLTQIGDSTKNIIFTSNTKIFKDNIGNKDIYDIKISNYIKSGDIEKLVNENNTFESVSKKAYDLFYQELKAKVQDKTLGKYITLTNTSLTDEDYKKIEELRILSNNYSSFKPEINSLLVLEEIIKNNNLEEEYLVSLWKNNRTFNQKISDLFANFNLPFGYLIIFFIFFIPTLFLLYAIDNKDGKNNLFKINIIFASFYTFLWTISAFGIVWYGITMYFSFLLAIAIGVYYLSSYSEKSTEKEFYIKLFGSLVVGLIIIIYFANSVFPHSFKNLKGAGYDKYKTGQVTTIDAPYLYHNEYLKILFHTNILKEKRLDFLDEFIDDDMKKVVEGINKMEIDVVASLLKEIANKYPDFKNAANRSLNNIYKNISNPSLEYKNTTGIYRIGTFLRYHISENNKRLLEDSLIFTFNDYIYDNDINKTVENLKKLGLEYLLVDLNAATIDKDERHNLTNRFEKLLRTFTSDKLELIETDSICLKIALEEFNKSQKSSEDYTRFMTIAGVNYESYSEDRKTIGRGTKLLKCYDTINDLIHNKKIDESNYNYLLNIYNYIVAKEDEFETENDIYKLLQKHVSHGYKVLFRIK